MSLLLQSCKTLEEKNWPQKPKLCGKNGVLVCESWGATSEMICSCMGGSQAIETAKDKVNGINRGN